MVVRELIEKSVYGTIGYISSTDNIELFESYVQYNLPVLKKFKKVIIAINYNGDGELVELFKIRLNKYLDNFIFLVNENNRGHNHGYADLDNMVVNYCKKNNIDWLCKSANDTVMKEDLFDKIISDADFYYLNGIGVGGMVKYNFDNKRIIEEDFYPQTNFYFINVSKIDYLNDENYLNETYNHIQSIPDYNGRIWEYVPGWSCEEFLKQCVKRNNLKIEHLISENNYISLLDLVKSNNIHDCSHKNIMIEGVCHFHYPKQPIYEINL